MFDPTKLIRFICVLGNININDSVWKSKELCSVVSEQTSHNATLQETKEL